MTKKKNNRPTASTFFDPLVKVLGVLTGYQTGVGISHKEVVDLVLREVGLDPEKPPWPLQGSKPLGLYRVIGFAHRNQRSDSVHYSGKAPSMCTSLGKGIWGLTSEGVERAKSLKDVPLYLEGFEPVPPSIEEKVREGDRRDDQTWVVLELTRHGEMKVEEDTLEASLRSDLELDPSHQIFIPALTYTRKGRHVTLQLMEGYVFLASGLPEVSYFALEEKSYVEQVMSRAGPHGIRVLTTISESSVDDMKRQLRGMSVLDLSLGDVVRVVEGLYGGLVMRYIGGEDDPNQALLESIGLRSTKIITCLPRAFLELVSEDEDYGFPVEEI